MINHEHDGYFVTLEGIDGAGKTSVAEAIDSEYKSTIRTQEPSDLWTGKQVRKAISNETDTNPMTTFYLFMADRVHHIEEIIKPGLADDMLVLSDRYADSTLAYQSMALDDYIRHTDKYIRHTMQPWHFHPDLTIFIDISVDTAIERSVGDEEYENRDFLKQVRWNYKTLARQDSDRFVVVDGEQDLESVKEDVLAVIEERYE
jgi:dTMP kinase